MEYLSFAPLKTEIKKTFEEMRKFSLFAILKHIKFIYDCMVEAGTNVVEFKELARQLEALAEKIFYEVQKSGTQKIEAQKKFKVMKEQFEFLLSLYDKVMLDTVHSELWAKIKSTSKKTLEEIEISSFKSHFFAVKQEKIESSTLLKNLSP